MSNCQFWRVSLTDSGLLNGTFTSLGLPPPTVSTYQDYKETRPKSNGQLALIGRPQYQAMFDITHSQQGWLLRRMVEQALAGTGYLYMTIPRADASGPNWDWVDIRGIPHRPLTSGDGSYAGRIGHVFYKNFTLFLEAVEIFNDPSTHTF